MVEATGLFKGNIYFMKIIPWEKKQIQEGVEFLSFLSIEKNTQQKRIDKELPALSFIEDKRK